MFVLLSFIRCTHFGMIFTLFTSFSNYQNNSEGFSIFLYGMGSKKQLLSQFQQEYLSDFDHIVVNGFFPSLTLKNVSTALIFLYSEYFFNILPKLIR